jgi:hypothetical protein
MHKDTSRSSGHDVHITAGVNGDFKEGSKKEEGDVSGIIQRAFIPLSANDA